MLSWVSALLGGGCLITLLRRILKLRPSWSRKMCCDPLAMSTMGARWEGAPSYAIYLPFLS